MNIELLVLLALLLAAAMVLLKYVWWTVGKGLQDLARLENDPQARAEKIAELDALLLKKSSDSPALLQRASLHRYDRNFSAAASDLQAYLALKPEDGEGWAELGECLIMTGAYEAALAAGEKATALDGEYPAYRKLLVQAGLLLKRFDVVRRELTVWRELDLQRLKRKPQAELDRLFPGGKIEVDAQLDLYEAALLLAQGQKREAAALLTKFGEDDLFWLEQECGENPALAGILELLKFDGGEENA